MKVYVLNPSAINKFMHQNNAEYTGDFVEGSLLDNFIISCKRGFIAVYEKYVNPNSSEYLFKFAAYKNKEDVDCLFSEFIEFERASELI